MHTGRKSTNTNNATNPERAKQNKFEVLVADAEMRILPGAQLPDSVFSMRKTCSLTCSAKAAAHSLSSLGRFLGLKPGGAVPHPTSFGRSAAQAGEKKLCPPGVGNGPFGDFP